MKGLENRLGRCRTTCALAEPRSQFWLIPGSAPVLALQNFMREIMVCTEASTSSMPRRGHQMGSH
jgi:hypothetical protein